RINGPPFKGFFVQARDALTNEWIGEFVKTKEVESFPECSAATHNTTPPKTKMLLTWLAPRDRTGNVIFTGTILERYDVYWSEMVAKVVPTVVSPGQSPVTFPLGQRRINPGLSPVGPLRDHRRG
ncbi:Ferric-chelate reductase 1-like, partial [Homarus americanus]